MHRILSPRSSRLHSKCRSVSYGMEAKTIGRKDGCSLPLSARNCIAMPMADRLTDKKKQGHFSAWSAEVTAVTAYPLGRALGEPTILCSRMDESIIVGYYTFAKVYLRKPSPSHATKKGGKPYGKK